VPGGNAHKLPIGELPGQRKRLGARGTWVWRALNASVSHLIHGQPQIGAIKLDSATQDMKCLGGASGIHRA
jgi:hypothetical protein